MPVARLSEAEFKRRLVAGSFPQFSDLSSALRGLGFVQADPIRSPARAQDLILRHRVAGYQAGDLESGFAECEAEEGYLFAYGFMPAELWGHFFPRPGPRLKKLEREVLEEVQRRDVTHPRDLEERFGRRSVTNYWGGKSLATKRVLEDLHERGFIRVCSREKGVRRYAALREPHPERLPLERFKELLKVTLKAFGPSEARWLFSELRHHNFLVKSKASKEKALAALLDEGEVERIEVDGVVYYWIRDQFTQAEPSSAFRILAPFDPLVRDRARFARLWKWDYRFEAYVPAAKRERGYYAMPILWEEEVIGWANAKVEAEVLSVELGYVDSRPKGARFKAAVEMETSALARFLGLGEGSFRLSL